MKRIQYFSSLSFILFTFNCQCLAQECHRPFPSVLDCSNQQLQHLDISAMTSIASTITVLKLNNNNLLKVPDLSLFSNAWTLDLSYNNISTLPPHVFRSLPRLLHLNISFNNLTLSNDVVTTETFSGLVSLKTLRLKQNIVPSPTFDYSALAPLGGTIEELYITGTPKLNAVFLTFTKLHTLSLGGSACNIPFMKVADAPVLSHLPLVRLSARNCKVTEIDRAFLKNHQRTLRKLDLSCNQLVEHFAEITNGLADSQLNTLILDHINKRGSTCPWQNTPDAAVAPLSAVPLKVLSLRANQISSTTDLNLQDHCSHILHLDLSQNLLTETVYYMIKAIRGEKVSNDDSANLAHFTKILPQSVQYLALENATGDIKCGETDNRLLDCNEDSLLFLEDVSSTTHQLPQTQILEFPLLRKIIIDNPGFQIMCRLINCSYTKTYTLISLDTISHLHDQFSHASIIAITKAAVHYLWYTMGGHLDAVTDSSLNEMPYLPAYVTTLAIGYNNFQTNSECSNSFMYLNNLQHLDMSHTPMKRFMCPSLVGLSYVQNFTCRYCAITGWNDAYYAQLPVKYMDLTGNDLGAMLREDYGNLFKSATRVVQLLVGEQLEGIRYFQNKNFLATLPVLSHLDLHSNNLISWNITLGSNSKIEFIDLGNNCISFIERQFREELDFQYKKMGLRIDLTANDVNCTSHSLEYIHWLLNSTTVQHTTPLRCLVTNELLEDFYWRQLHPSTTNTQSRTSFSQHTTKTTETSTSQPSTTTTQTSTSHPSTRTSQPSTRTSQPSTKTTQTSTSHPRAISNHPTHSTPSQPKKPITTAIQASTKLTRPMQATTTIEQNSSAQKEKTTSRRQAALSSTISSQGSFTTTNEATASILTSEPKPFTDNSTLQPNSILSTEPNLVTPLIVTAVAITVITISVIVVVCTYRHKKTRCHRIRRPLPLIQERGGDIYDDLLPDGQHAYEGVRMVTNDEHMGDDVRMFDDEDVYIEIVPEDSLRRKDEIIYIENASVADAEEPNSSITTHS